MRALGFPAEFIRDAGLPFQTCGAVIFPDMAQFHPLRFLHGLARGLRVFAHTYAERIDLKTNTVLTSRGKIPREKNRRCDAFSVSQPARPVFHEAVSDALVCGGRSKMRRRFRIRMWAREKQPLFPHGR